MRRRLVALALATAWTASVCGQAAPTPLDSARDRPSPRNIQEFDRMFTELRNWGRWGKDDQLGTINLVTPAKTREAAALVKAGVSVSLSHNPIAEAVPDSPYPSYVLEMAGTMSDVQHFNYHGYVTSHIDSLCHFDWRGSLYNGVSTEANNTSTGCKTLGIEALKNGVITRGVLIDIPRLRGVPYLEPGDAVFTQDLEAVAATAAKLGRWDFMLTVAPIPAAGATGGPINVLATF